MINELSDLNDVFAVSATSLLAKNSKTEGIFYMPSAEKGIDKVYSSQIKFITNIHNPSKSLIKKWTVWLQNPDTEEKKSVDCPSTVDQPSLLQDAFFALWNSPSAHDKALSDKFKRREVFFSLVYIVKDEHNPSAEGKIKIFKFGKQLYEVLEASAKDPDEPNDFLNFFEGRTLRLKIVEKSGYNHFSQSNFGTKVHEIEINGEKMTDTPKNRKILASWLKENSPDLSEYAFKPWDEEMRKFIIEAIKAIIPNENMVNKLLKKSGVDISKTKKVDLIDEDEIVAKPKSKIPKVVVDDERPLAKKVPKKIIIDDDEDELNLDDIDDSELDEIDAHISKINSKNKSVSKKQSRKIIIEDDDEDEDED